MKAIQKSKRGLCLIESVLVVAIICVLASVLVLNFVKILEVLDVSLGMFGI